MERLTKPNTVYCKDICDGAKACDGNHDPFDLQCAYAVVYDRLAAYEDTGLSPEEVQNIVTFENEKLFPDKELTLFGKPISHWAEINNAEQQRRLVVLPCKVGTVVWSSELTEIDDDGVEHVAPWSFVPGMMDEWGKSFFLTREEAEKALKGVSEDA